MYQCDKCSETYDTIERADKCELTHFEPKHFSIVDIGTEPNSVNEWPKVLYIKSAMIGTTALYKYHGVEILGSNHTRLTIGKG